MQIQKNFPVTALAGFHVLSALANIATGEGLAFFDDDQGQSPEATLDNTSEVAPISYPLLA